MHLQPSRSQHAGHWGMQVPENRSVTIGTSASLPAWERAGWPPWLGLQEKEKDEVSSPAAAEK